MSVMETSGEACASLAWRPPRRISSSIFEIDTELERADANAGRTGELRKIERLTSIFREIVPRDAERARQAFGLP